jgi:Flp pilus assembly pilin Flp
MNRLISQLKSFCRDASGATAIEYGLIVAMVGIALVAIGSSQYGFGAKEGFNQLGQNFADAVKVF